MGKDLKGKELGTGILQRKNGVYEARYVNRFGKRKTIAGTILKDVKKRFMEAVYENEKEINLREENIKLDDWFIKWLDVYKHDLIRKNTRRAYKQVYYKHISSQLGNLNIKDITQLDIRELLKKMDTQGYNYATKNRIRIMLLDMFNKALLDEFVKKNPAKGISIRQNKEKDIRVLSLDEQTLFFDCCKGTFYDNLFVVAVNTGMRVGELAALKWEDIDIDKKIIHVNKTLIYQRYEDDECKEFHFELPKTKSSFRDIPMNRQCELALKKQYMQKSIVKSKSPKKPKTEFEDLLFTTKFNTPLNTQIVSDAIKNIVKEINLMLDVTEEMEYFSCHCFRHTFATRCFESGIQPKTVQTYLGHATLQMTMDLYTSVLEEHQISEIEKLDNVFAELSENDTIMTEGKFHELEKKNEKLVDFEDYMVM